MKNQRMCEKIAKVCAKVIVSANAKQRPKCVVCNKLLKVFEKNLCSCKLSVCMKHKQRLVHRCPDGAGVTPDLVKVVAPKVVKI